METIVRDVKYGVRTLLRAPLFTTTMALMVGGGLGVLCAVFSLFNAYVLRPFPIANPQTVYDFTWNSQASRRHLFTWDEFEALRRDSDIFSSAYAARQTQASIDGHTLSGQLVTGNYFSVLGVRPFLGRVLRADDADGVVVLSHDAWVTRFGADRAALGRTISIIGLPHEIVGVAAPEFVGIRDYPADFWVPLTSSSARPPLRPNAVDVTGRLKEGLTEDQARVRLEAWTRRVTTDLPERERPRRILLESRATRLPRTATIAAFFTLILGLVGLILVVACTNAASMMLVRATARERELAIRLSLGATRSALVRQLVTEGVLVAVPGAVVGAALTYAITRVAPRAAIDSLPPAAVSAMRMLFTPLPVDATVISFLFIAAVCAAALFSVGPALKATRNIAIASNLTAATSRLHRGALIIQLGACVLFVVAGMGLLQGARDSAMKDPGLDIDHVIDVRIAAPLARRTSARLSSHPEVEDIAFTLRPPLFGPLNTIEVGVAGERLRAGYNFVSRGYFRVFGIPLLAGRTFSQGEEEGGARVAIVSAATARRFWPDGGPLGRTIRLAASRGNEAAMEHDVVVIGVVGDVMSGLVVDGIDQTVVYLPTNVSDEREQALLVRTRSAASAALPAIDAAVVGETGDAARQLAPMRDVLRFQSWPLLLFGSAMSGLAAFGIVLALAGCYGMLAYMVARRSRELGIRAAVGATTGALAWLIARQSALIASIAIPAGIVLALGLSKIMTSTLDMAPSFGMSSFIIGAIAGLATTAAASYLPTRRATRVDPAEALRAE